MTEENIAKPDMVDASEPVNALGKAVDKLLDSAHVRAVYGEPIRNGDTVVIPSAEVLGVLGVGYGKGETQANDQQAGGGGSGGGGGGRTLSRPVAAIVIGPSGVRVEPIVDKTKIWMAALTAAGFVMAMMARMGSRRPPRLDEAE